MAKKGVRKQVMNCLDGPWKGVKLYVATCQTMYLTIGGVDGRYVNGYWELKNENRTKPESSTRPARNR